MNPLTETLIQILLTMMIAWGLGEILGRIIIMLVALIKYLLKG